MIKRIAVAAGLALAGVALAPGFGGQAEAHTVVGIGLGFGVPVYPGPYYYPPYYYYPPPVVYSPPPVVVAPPATPSYVAQPNQSWYYCDNPKGYYPYVTSCPEGWRQVPAQPESH